MLDFNLMDKLKALNFDEEFRRDIKMKPMSRYYFCVSSNPGEQFHVFTCLGAWLSGKCGKPMERPQEDDDPNFTISSLLDSARYGEYVIYILDKLTEKALQNGKYDWESLKIEPENQSELGDGTEDGIDDQEEVEEEEEGVPEEALYSDDSEEDGYAADTNNIDDHENDKIIKRLEKVEENLKTSRAPVLKIKPVGFSIEAYSSEPCAIEPDMLNMCIPMPTKKIKVNKTTRNVENWKANIAKKLRYSPQTLPELPECKHNTKKFKCGTLQMNELMKFHSAFYKTHNKQLQDALLLKFCTPISVKPKRPKDGVPVKMCKKYTTSFCVLVNNKKVPVCQKSFLSILGIKRPRVERIVSKFYDHMELATETRGGDHKSHKYAGQVQAIYNFMSSLQFGDEYYCKGASCGLKYLPAQLSINKLYDMFKKTVPEAAVVKKSYFRNVFTKHYNLTFGSPEKDVCPKCHGCPKEKKKTTNNSPIIIDMINMNNINNINNMNNLNNMNSSNTLNMLNSETLNNINNMGNLSATNPNEMVIANNMHNVNMNNAMNANNPNSMASQNLDGSMLNVAEIKKSFYHL